MSKSIKVNRTLAIAVFSAAGWKEAETWPTEKMELKLKDVPDCVDDDFKAEGDNAAEINGLISTIADAVKEAGDKDPVFEVVDAEPAAEVADDKKEAEVEQKKEEDAAKATAKKNRTPEEIAADDKKKADAKAEREKKKAEREKAKAEAAAKRAPTWQVACAQAIRESGKSLGEVDIKAIAPRVVELRKSGNEKTALWALRTLITAVTAWESSVA